jgi:hypothetical protein
VALKAKDSIASLLFSNFTSYRIGYGIPKEV